MRGLASFELTELDDMRSLGAIINSRNLSSETEAKALNVRNERRTRVQENARITEHGVPSLC